jgi:hypothetical protein
VTSVVSNRLIPVAPAGSHERMLKDGAPAHIAWVEEAYAGGAFGRPHIDRVVASKRQSLSSLVFGGAGRRSAYRGVLLGDRLPRPRLPVASAKMVRPEWR